MCRALNYFERFLTFVSAASCCVSISAFVLLVAVPVGNASSAVGINICVITEEIKKYKLIVKKKKKKHDQIALLAKNKLNTIEFFFSKALNDSYINYDKFISVNNVLQEYNEMKKEIKNCKNTVNISYKNNGSILCQL